MSSSIDEETEAAVEVAGSEMLSFAFEVVGVKWIFLGEDGELEKMSVSV